MLPLDGGRRSWFLNLCTDDLIKSQWVEESMYVENPRLTLCSLPTILATSDDYLKRGMHFLYTLFKEYEAKYQDKTKL